MKLNASTLKKTMLRAIKRLSNECCADCAESAGFIFAPGQKKGQRKGVQIFVSAHRYSEELRNRKPLTGGLISADIRQLE